MIVVRDVFQIQPDRMKEAKATMKEIFAAVRPLDPGFKRALTDVTGEFYTMVLESEYADLAEYEKALKNAMAAAEFQKLYPKFRSMIRGGSREMFEVFV